MRLCVIWNLHQPNSWHPTQRAFALPWTRIQTLRSYLPFLRMIDAVPDAPVTIAVSADVLRHLEQTTMRATRETLLDIHRKPATDLRAPEVVDLVSFGLGAASERLVQRYPQWHALWQRWQTQRGIVSRFVETVSKKELQDLQALAQIGWIDDSLRARVPELERKAVSGSSFDAGDANRLVDLQVDAMQEFLQLLRERCREGRIEFLGTTLHRCVLPLLAGEMAEYRYPEDVRGHLIRGPRVQFLQFGKWPTVMALAEGGLCPQTAALLGQACFHQAVSSSRVLARTLGRLPSAEELCSRWDYRGRSFLFADAELCDQIRFVYPHQSVEDALKNLGRRVASTAGACTDPEAALTVELDVAIDAEADPADRRAFWGGLLSLLAGAREGLGGAPVRGSSVAGALAAMPRRTLEEIRSYSQRARGFSAWNAGARPLYWKLLSHAREQFQNVRAWKTLSPERLTDAKASLFVLESVDWMRCMEAGLDPYTQRKTEELFRAHLDCIYRSLDVPRPVNFAEPLLPCDVKVTSIGPSQYISPMLDGKASSYHSWSGSGFYRTREEGGCSRDFLRQLSGVYFGSDSVHAYLRVALPISAREMLREFELQGVFHASEGEQTVSWFRVGLAEDGAVSFDARLAVPPADRLERTRAAVEDVVDLQIPLSGLGVRLGEVLRFQVSLWEHGNAVASAPTLGWEEFPIGDHLTYEGDTARVRGVVNWGVPAR